MQTVAGDLLLEESREVAEHADPLARRQITRRNELADQRFRVVAGVGGADQLELVARDEPAADEGLAEAVFDVGGEAHAWRRSVGNVWRAAGFIPAGTGSIEAIRSILFGGTKPRATRQSSISANDVICGSKSAGGLPGRSERTTWKPAACAA